MWKKLGRSACRTSRVGIAVGIGLAGIANSVRADDYWTAGSGNFATAGGWNTSSVPTGSVNADVYDGGVVTISTTVSMNDLRAGTGGQSGLQSGTGSVTVVTGSSATVNAWLRVSTQDNTSAASGSLTVNGGLLNVNTGFANIGESGTGTVNVNGGVFNTAGYSLYDFQIGGQSVSPTTNGTGILNVNNGTVNTDDNLMIGATGTSTGTVNIDGGTFNNLGSCPVTLGNAGTATGTMNISSGTYYASGASLMLLGNASGTRGIINVTGGQMLLNNPGDGNILEIGGTFGGSGLVNVTGTGVLSTNASEIWVGKGGAGILNVSSGGTVSFGDWLAVGRNGGSGTVNLGPGGTMSATAVNGGNVTFDGTIGVINQSGGTFNNTVSQTWMGQAGSSYYNISGGTANLALMILGEQPGTNGTINLTGDVFSPTQIENGLGNGTINFNGGTLQANSRTNFAAAALFLTGVTSVNVLGNGGTIDTNGQNITISQPLTHAGAAGIDGGIKKIGAGTLTLNGGSTYSGGTAVTSGTLTAAAPYALGTGTVTLTGNSTLRLAAGQATLSGFPSETLNGGATLSSNVLTLTDANYNEARSAFTTQPVMVSDVTGFTAHFVWQAITGPVGLADGITFVIQRDPRGATAIGGSGMYMGYEGGANAIVNSVGIVLDTFNNVGTAEPGTGYSDVVGGTMMQRTASPIVLSQDPVAVDLSYANGTLGMVLTDQITNVSTTSSYQLDLNSLLGGSAGYIGFTGSTGGNSSTQTISNFTFSNNTFGSVSIPNAVTAASGTKSVIQIPVLTGQAGASVGPITVTAGSTLTLSATGATAVLPPAVLSTPTLTIAGTTGNWSGLLDIGRNDLDVTLGSLSLTTNQVSFGENLTGGANWNGPGITSSAAAGDTSHLTAVGAIQNNQSGTPIYTAANPFDGTVPGVADILVKYTWFGDANLDGKVDGSDYSLIDAGYGSKGILTGWFDGDFNYDGVIDGSDYALIDNAFNNQTGNLSTAAVLAFATDETFTPAAVPEPEITGLLAIVTGLLVGRYRQAGHSDERSPSGKMRFRARLIAVAAT